MDRLHRRVPAALPALNMLYILVATGRAAIDRRHKSKELFFNVKPQAALPLPSRSR